MFCGEKKGLFGCCSTIEQTRCAFSRKIATVMTIFFAFENIYYISLFDITLIRAGVAVQGPLVKVYKD